MSAVPQARPTAISPSVTVGMLAARPGGRQSGVTVRYTAGYAVPTAAEVFLDPVAAGDPAVAGGRPLRRVGLVERVAGAAVLTFLLVGVLCLPDPDMRSVPQAPVWVTSGAGRR